MDDRGNGTGVREPPPERLLERARRLVYRLLGPHEANEDLAQTAMEQYLRSKQRHRGEGTLEAFVDGIVVNVVRGYMRKQRTGVLVRELVAVRAEWTPLPDGPADRTQSRECLRRLLSMLERMKPKYRVAYLLYHVDGRTVEQIAEIEGTTVSAVRTRILRARRELEARARRDPVLAEWLARREESP
jgi:RNA polymerase sigma-70 factor (ECF subfamily)